MLKQFQSFLNKEQLFTKKDLILLTVSGGMDSIAMVYLFKQAGYHIGIAHCNFQLRGDDSDKDEVFVQELAKKLNIPFHNIRFNTNKEAQLQKTSTQIVARTLRYEWFEQLRITHQYTHIATAHHLNDSLETVLLNLTKGCGIKGLHGIPLRQTHIVRPLLFATRQEIQQFIQKQEIPYREDASNQSTKYQRNLIRHKVIPSLKTINPSLESTFGKTLHHLRDTEILFNEIIQQYQSKITKQIGNSFFIQKKELLDHPAKHTLLYELIAPYGFNGTHVAQLLDSYEQIGATFSSISHQLLVDREFLVIKSRNKIKENYKLVKEKISTLIFNSQEIKLTYGTKEAYPLKQPATTALLDYNQLVFPLTLRYWKEGDRFQPLGMNGQSKKLQDFFSDLKLSRFEKEEVIILESNGIICWVAGYRIDERFKITAKTDKVVKVDLRSMINLVEVKTDKEYEVAIKLFREYASQLNVDLSFQNFDQELIEINKQYCRPHGIIFIAYGNGKEPIGCFGIRKFADSICELKRMYLKKEMRGMGIGQQLLSKAIKAGKELDYKKMRLDTLPSMESAIGLYKKVGFYEIDAYRFNPIDGTKYFEKLLSNE